MSFLLSSGVRNISSESETYNLATANNNENRNNRVGFVFEAEESISAVTVKTEDNYNNGHADARISTLSGTTLAEDSGTFGVGVTHEFTGLSLTSGTEYRVTVDPDGNAQMADLSVSYPQAEDKQLMTITSGWDAQKVNENWTFSSITVESA